MKSSLILFVPVTVAITIFVNGPVPFQTALTIGVFVSASFTVCLPVTLFLLRWLFRSEKQCTKEPAAVIHAEDGTRSLNAQAWSDYQTKAKETKKEKVDPTLVRESRQTPDQKRVTAQILAQLDAKENRQQRQTTRQPLPAPVDEPLINVEHKPSWLERAVNEINEEKK